jgi:oligopeptide transport system substrate-binding protein
MKTKFYSLLGLLIIASLLLGACGSQATQIAPEEPSTGVNEPAAVNEEPAAGNTNEPAPAELVSMETKIIRTNLGPGDVPTLDPAIGQDSSSIQIVNETTIGLTNISPVDSELYPGMAETWDIVNNEDGTQTITFHLRRDIPWVRWNGDEVETVKTCDGSADRMVNAHDFAYGIYRNQLPANASPYAYLLGFVLQGAAEFNNGETDDFSFVGLQVIDDFTLEMTFLTQAVYNQQIAGLWVARPQPKWLIEGETDADGNTCVEARGERWTETGFFQSYGPFTVKEWIHDSSITLVRNPFWPGIESVPQSKIDEVQLLMLDTPPAFAEYEAGNLDVSGIPLADLDRVKADPDLSQELKIIPDAATYYVGFNTKAPFVDDVRVRRALSLAIDRQSLIDNVLKGGQLPAHWFTVPGLAGAPTMESHPDLGITYDPEAAKALLDEYLQEKGLTADQLDLTYMFNTSAGHQAIAETLQQMWADTLGINVKLASQEWKVYLNTIKSSETPQLYKNAWGQDYPDANNFLREVFAVNGNNNPAENGEPYGGSNWRNDAFEEIVAQAAVETDPDKRAELYAQAEQILIWDDAVIAPLYWYTRVSVTKPYVVRTYGIGGQEAFETWDVLPQP